MIKGRLKQKVRFYDDETGRVAVAREFAHYWVLWSTDLGDHTFTHYELVEQFAKFNGFEPGDVTRY